MKMNVRIIMMFCLLVCSLQTIAQQREIKGTVFFYDNLPVGNVKVSAKKSGDFALSDSLGNFSISCEPKDVLYFEGEVFQKATKKIKKNTEFLEMNLIFIVSDENKRLAAENGYVTDEKLLGSIINDNNVFCSYPSVFDAIKGRFSNVIVEDECVYVRGINTLSGNSCALFVVDGQVSNSITEVKDINPCSIKSISLVKGDAAAMYGVRGSNGVILIERK